jgi:hypothetical protein
VPHLEQELLTLPEHLSLPPVFGGVRVARSFWIIFILGLIIAIELFLCHCCITIYHRVFINCIMDLISSCLFHLFSIIIVLPHLEQELLTLPEHLSLPPVFGGVRVARSLVFCLVFCISLFDLFLFTLSISSSHKHHI